MSWHEPTLHHVLSCFDHHIAESGIEGAVKSHGPDQAVKGPAKQPRHQLDTARDNALILLFDVHHARFQLRIHGSSAGRPSRDANGDLCMLPTKKVREHTARTGLSRRPFVCPQGGNDPSARLKFRYA